MIIIADDTFSERHKFNDVTFLQKEKYQKICQLETELKVQDVERLLSKAKEIELFCCHYTLQLFDNEGNALNSEENDRERSQLITKLNQAGVAVLFFSGSLMVSSFESKRVDKNLFYANLNAFLDYYLHKRELETRIIFYGPSFQTIERNTAIQELFRAIRKNSLSQFKNNQNILKGLKYLFEVHEIDQKIEGWQTGQLTKKQIIQEINSKIAE